jgi:hypothetical protein
MDRWLYFHFITAKSKQYTILKSLLPKNKLKRHTVEVLIPCTSNCTWDPNWNKAVRKVKFTLKQVTKVQGGEQTYSSTLSLTLRPDEDWWSMPHPGRIRPGKETHYPLYRRLGGPKGRSGRVRKISPLPGFDPRTVQPVASCYIDWAIPAHK